MDFKLRNGEENVTLIPLLKASATVITAGKMVALDGTNLVVEADASDLHIAFCPFGAIAGETTVLVVKEKEAVFLGTANTAYYAATDLRLECDLAISAGHQVIDLGNTATKVLQVNVRSDSGIDGSTDNIQVYINKPLVNNE